MSGSRDSGGGPLFGFREFVSEAIREWKVPGVAVAIVKGGEVLFSEGFGYRDVAKKLPVSPETVFAIGSCSKAFTSATMAMLVDEGKVVWDKPVRDYLPDFRMYDPVATERMTPRDLLCHRSGLPRHDLAWYGNPATREELFHRLQYLEPAWDFRQRYHYQNLMFMAAGCLVGRVEGTTWEKFTQRRIFRPLGMTSSNFSVEDTKKGTNYSLPYEEKETKVVEIPFRNIDAIGPAGSINSNIVDMARWISLHLAKGEYNGRRLVSVASLTETHKPHSISIPEPSAVDLSKYSELGDACYCLGWGMLPYRGHRVIRHGGGIDGFISAVAFLPDDGYGVVVLSNLSGTSLPTIILYNALDRLLGLPQIDWASRVREEIDRLKQIAEREKGRFEAARKPGTRPFHPLADYAGEYVHPGYGSINVYVAGEALEATFAGTRVPMEHYHYDVFTLVSSELPAPVPVSFRSDFMGNVESLAAPLDVNLKPIVFTRRMRG